MIRRLLSLALLPLLAQYSFAQIAPEKAIATMTAGEGLQVELFASEPMLINPTSIDIDDKGRVWVAEAVNYRRKNFNRPILREEGDRIQVLIDEKGDGQATKAVTFYQGTELYGPLGVCIIPVGKGYRVLVAQSPDILEFTCKDSSNPVADGPPKKFLTGFGGFDHDHGVHGLNIGPDGKLYFTVGDAGVNGLQSSDGKGKKYSSNNTDIQKGTVWRCDLDGKNLELLAHNFRNNYECCVDSFGEIWLSDNDDDGNQQTRICHVMPGGNYGYGPRGPGQSHWHEEQPGIVHKTLRTGFGSPTGICFYEGSLLPKKYQGEMIHADAGPREIRSFKRKPKGAGYELEKSLMLTSTDTWYRPSDVCVAPDGSVFVADWYDPGVGGHGMGDWTRGRIYRLTPKGHKGYKVPEVKRDTKEGVLAALASPNSVTRALLFSDLTPKGIEKQAVLLFDSRDQIVKEPITSARSIWLMARAYTYPMWIEMISTYRRAKDESLRPLAERMIDSFYWQDQDHNRFFEYTEKDAAPYKDYNDFRVLREMLLWMRKIENPNPIINLFYVLAKKYDGRDIFYRAALNIACGTDPVRRDAMLADFEKHFPEWNDKVADLVWELRPKSMLPKMEKLLADPKITALQKARIVDIIASSDDLSAGKTMLALLASDAGPEAKARALDSLKLFLPTKWQDLKKGKELGTAIDSLLQDPSVSANGLQLIAVTNDVSRVDSVAKIALGGSTEAIRTLGRLRTLKSVETLKTIAGKSTFSTKPATGTEALKSLAALVTVQAKDEITAKALAAIQEQFGRKDYPDMQKAAVEALAGTRLGTQWLLESHAKGNLAQELLADAGRLLRNSPFPDLRNKAVLAFPAPGKLDPKKLPPIAELAKRTGNADNGKAIMAKSLVSEVQCMKCHTVRGQGGSIGPDLSMVGKKSGKEALYESLFTPSKAIADQYLSWKVDAEDGQSITGLLVGETETTLTIRDANGKDYQFPVKGTEKKKQLTSIMPEGLVATLTEDEVVDVVEYLSKLQTPSLTPDAWQIAGPFPRKLDDEVGSLDKLKWRTVKIGQTGYVDLAAFHGDSAKDSVSVLTRTVESPVDQEVTVLLGTDDGCRLFVNGEKVFGVDHMEAAKPERDSVKVKLKKGSNAIVLRVGNGDNPHGFYFTIASKEELKLVK